MLLMPGFSIAQQVLEDNPILKDDTTSVNYLIQKSKENLSENPDTAISYANQALEIADKINFSKGAATALKNIGIVYFLQGKALEALDFYDQSLKRFIELNDYSGIANLYSNIGALHYDRGDDTKALENYLESLKYAEKAEDKFRILIALNNVGGIYFIKKATYDKSLEYYKKALKLCEELDKKEEMGTICVNIGSIYFEKDEDSTALSYFNQALAAFGNSEGSLHVYNSLGKLYAKEGKFEMAIQNHTRALATAEKTNNLMPILESLMGLGKAYLKKGDYKKALVYYTRSEKPAVEARANHELKDLYQEMAQTYAKIADYNKAFKYQSLYSSIKDTIYNTDTDKKIGMLQFDFDLSKKQTEINLLTKDKDIQAVNIKRQKLAKNAFLAGLILAFIIAVLIFRGYRVKVRTNKILDKQKDEIEHLLLNILPKEVANELQTSGESKPRHYEEVSVLFTDFQGFTSIADKLSPTALVEQLNECFLAFDAIIEKYNLEKIKTIGDAYMCAGNIPSPNPGHAYKIIKAALEIQEFMERHNVRRAEKGMQGWQIRIGVHIGPVVAGVVGKKKYAYDIWGNAVNVASRMESNGTPGRVNISADTHEIVKEWFVCSHRGKIYAKNLGDLDMFYVDYEKSQVSDIQILHSATREKQYIENA